MTFDEDPVRRQLDALQENYPLALPAYWSLHIGHPAIRLKKHHYATVADWWILSAGRLGVAPETRVLRAHPFKRDAYDVGEYAVEDLAPAMYQRYLFGEW